MAGGKPRSDEGLGARLIAAAIIFASVAAGIGVLYQSRYDQDAANHIREYAKYSDQKIAEACRGVSEIELVHCFSDARIKSELEKRENQHNEADLIAQRRTALWTTIMGIAALIGMALSAAGVLLVWRTFRAAHQANQIAKDAQRPWLKIEAELTEVSFEYELLSLRYSVKVTNLGKMVAERCAIRGKLIERDDLPAGQRSIALVREQAERIADIKEEGPIMP
jgi:hypothetical protein